MLGRVIVWSRKLLHLKAVVGEEGLELRTLLDLGADSPTSRFFRDGWNFFNHASVVWQAMAGDS